MHYHVPVMTADGLVSLVAPVKSSWGCHSVAILAFPVFFLVIFILRSGFTAGRRPRRPPFIGHAGRDEAMATAKRIGVTGGTGFIGRHVVCECRRRGHEVERLQRLCGAPQAGVRHYDLEHLRSVTPELLAGVDAVIHLAALVHVPGAPPDRHQRLNFLATRTLFDMCEKVGVGVSCSEVRSAYMERTPFPGQYRSPTRPSRPRTTASRSVTPKNICCGGRHMSMSRSSVCRLSMASVPPAITD